MDTKANLSNRKKINELAIQHNKLTTLVACLLNEVGSLKKELNDVKSGDNVNNSRNDNNNPRNNQQSNNQQNNNQNNNHQSNPNKFPNFNELRAEDILKQLSINNSDN
jgi:Sec-independent protein translocase protein TatA